MCKTAFITWQKHREAVSIGELAEVVGGPPVGIQEDDEPDQCLCGIDLEGTAKAYGLNVGIDEMGDGYFFRDGDKIPRSTFHAQGDRMRIVRHD